MIHSYKKAFKRPCPEKTPFPGGKITYIPMSYVLEMDG
jgi:hypothetical protein